MTKAAEKAAAVRANKLEAFGKKVRSLLGHVTLANATILEAFESGTTADAFAAEVAAREPVGNAVHARKEAAVNHAEKAVRARIEKTLNELEAAGWDRNAYAPYPRYNQYGPEADAAKAKHNWVHSLTSNGSGSYRSGQPDIAQRDERGIERQVQFARETTALQYDAFICKMVKKVGPCLAAQLTGDHIWGHSFLTVMKPGGSTERWKTQQIVNYSVLGNAYYQWPSRIVK